MTRDNNPDRLDDGARAEAEMKEREAPSYGEAIPEDMLQTSLMVWIDALRDGTPDAAKIIARAILADRNRVPAPQGDDTLVGEIEAGLEGVAPGPWEAKKHRTLIHVGGYHSVCEISVSANHIHEDNPGDKQAYISRQTATAAHIARCSPDNIAKIIAGYRSQAAEIAGLKAERDAAEEKFRFWMGEHDREIAERRAAESRLASAMEAPEPFASTAKHFEHMQDDGGSVMCNIRLSDLRRARTTLSNLKGEAE